MITSTEGCEFCIVGEGKLIHVRPAGTPKDAPYRKPVCGAAKGANRGMIVARQHIFPLSTEDVNRLLRGGKYKLCVKCQPS